MSNDKTSDELRRDYEAALEMFRAAQDAFELSRADLRGVRESANRIRELADTAAAAAGEARHSGMLAIQAAAGEMTAEVLAHRRELREAKDLAEDYRELAESAAAEVARAEVPALRNARTMEDARIKALSAMADLALQEALASSLPRFARALHLYNALARPDIGSGHHTRGLIEAIDIIMPLLRRALLDVELEAVELPEDLIRPGNISPLRWSEAASPIYIAKREGAAGIRSGEVMKIEESATGGQMIDAVQGVERGRIAGVQAPVIGEG